MADAKLNELIQTLKKQGIESGEEEARQVIESAKKEADEIIAQANSKSKTIISKAESAADQQLRQLQSSLEIASSQFVTALKKVTEENLLVIPLKEALRGELSNAGLLKELMTTFVKSYAGNPHGADIRMLLPEDAGDELFEHAVGLMADYWGRDQAGDQLDLVLKTRDVQFGFQVDRTEGSVRLDFTSDAFLSLFLEYLAPRFRGLFKQVKLEKEAGK